MSRIFKELLTRKQYKSKLWINSKEDGGASCIKSLTLFLKTLLKVWFNRYAIPSKQVLRLHQHRNTEFFYFYVKNHLHVNFPGGVAASVTIVNYCPTFSAGVNAAYQVIFFNFFYFYLIT